MKVGYASNIRRRFSSYNTANPFPQDKTMVAAGLKDEVRSVEKSCLDMFKGMEIHNKEWFRSELFGEVVELVKASTLVYTVVKKPLACEVKHRRIGQMGDEVAYKLLQEKYRG